MEANKAQQISHVSQLFVIQENNGKKNKIKRIHIYLSSFWFNKMHTKAINSVKCLLDKTKCLKSIIHVHAFNTNQNINTKNGVIFFITLSSLERNPKMG